MEEVKSCRSLRLASHLSGLHHRDTMWWQITNQIPAGTLITKQVLTAELFCSSFTVLCQTVSLIIRFAARQKIMFMYSHLYLRKLCGNLELFFFNTLESGKHNKNILYFPAGLKLMILCLIYCDCNEECIVKPLGTSCLIKLVASSSVVADCKPTASTSPSQCEGTCERPLSRASGLCGRAPATSVDKRLS